MEQPILPFINQYKKYSQSITPFIQSPKTKSYSTVIFFFLVLSVFGWYAIRPTIQTILYLQREIKDKTETNKKMDEKIYALIEANSAYENSQPLLPVLSEAIPTAPDALDLVSQINILATNTNVILSSLQMSGIPLATQSGTANPKNTKAYTEFPIVFSVEGPYLSVVSFLKGLVSMKRIVTVGSLNFVPVKKTVFLASESGNPALIKVSINLSGYYETK
jgi:Tfp pilus assembly protein PilO